MEEHNLEALRSVLGKEVVVSGMAHYRPSGRLLLLDVEALDDATITSTSSLFSEVSSGNDAGSGILNRWAAEVLGDYEFTSNSGTRKLAFGERVRVARDPIRKDALFQPVCRFGLRARVAGCKAG